jgi:cellobiose-specific phosphotransferase system component IIB
MTNGLKIVSSGLLVANMSIYACITGCSCQIFAFSEGNVLAVWTSIAFSKTEIDNVDVVFCWVSTTD